MNDDYLWDGSGSDPEIEAIEAKLRVFRSKQDFAPSMKLIPQNSGFLSIPAILKIGFAFASLAVIVLASFTIYFDSALPSNQVSIDFEDDPAQTAIAVVPSLTESAGSAPDSRRSLGSKESSRPRRTMKSIGKLVKADPRKTGAEDSALEAGVEKVVVEDHFAALTDEEKYAYDQLMLALSITGEKLRLVRDKVGGNQDTGKSKGTDNK